MAKPQRTVLVASVPDCTVHAACKDADGYLRQHGEIRLRDLIGRTVPAELSREGEIKRLAAIAGELDRAAAIKAAWKDKTVLHGIPIAMLREHVAAERAKAHPHGGGEARWSRAMGRTRAAGLCPERAGH